MSFGAQNKALKGTKINATQKHLDINSETFSNQKITTVHVRGWKLGNGDQGKKRAQNRGDEWQTWCSQYVISADQKKKKVISKVIRHLQAPNPK